MTRRVIGREIAAGIDLERDVLDRMGFKPRMPPPPREIDPRILQAALMGLRAGRGRRWWRWRPLRQRRQRSGLGTQCEGEAMSAQEQVVSRPEDHITLLTLNRPEARNALNFSLLERMEEAIATLQQETGLRVLIITGTGSSFCSGADLREIRDFDGCCLAIPRQSRVMRTGSPR